MGKHSGGQKQHLIAWNRVCSPEGEGSLGIRKASEMNKALITKVRWRLFQDKSSLWAKVVHCKYRVGELDDHTWFDAKRNRSSTWRSIKIGIREVLLRG